MKTGLKMASAVIFGSVPMIAAAGSLASLQAAVSLRATLCNALAETGNTGCAAAAARLSRNADNTPVSLHLRDIGLTLAAFTPIARVVGELSDAEASSLVSLSVSYNPALGDAGALALANSLP